MLPTSFWIELHSQEPPLFGKYQIFHPLSRRSKTFFCLFSVCYLNCSKKFDSEQCTYANWHEDITIKYSFNLSPHIYTIPCYGELSRMNFKLCTVLYICGISGRVSDNRNLWMMSRIVILLLLLYGLLTYLSQYTFALHTISQARI